MTPQQISTVRKYLRGRFKNETLELKPRAMAGGVKEDSVEVWMDDEILGLLYIDDEDPSDISYDLNISILGEDL